MYEATKKDKPLVADILTNSFDANQSVNYVIQQDTHRKERINALMNYSFDICKRYGKVYLSKENKSCALVLLPEQKKQNWWTLLKDMQLMFSSIGFFNIGKALKRESAIKDKQLTENVYYIWFIGVNPDEQNNGYGSAMLNSLLNEAAAMNRTVCLETSTIKNLPWYKKHGFEIYDELDLGYKLYFLKK
ncbi:GNAT family N-acetyltransferase [Pelobium manganitolerans]|uniref:GNAT family N-acetyltransferase n=1 Tax=Pelobium manganitolerans TaxID=1842495 RepID=UPI003FA35252